MKFWENTKASLTLLLGYFYMAILWPMEQGIIVTIEAHEDRMNSTVLSLLAFGTWLLQTMWIGFLYFVVRFVLVS